MEMKGCCKKCRWMREWDENNPGINYGAGDWMCQECLNRLKGIKENG